MGKKTVAGALVVALLLSVAYVGYLWRWRRDEALTHGVRSTVIPSKPFEREEPVQSRSEESTEISSAAEPEIRSESGVDRPLTILCVDHLEKRYFIERYLGGSREIWPSLFEVRADVEGHFEFAGIPRGSGVQLVAEAPGLGWRGFDSGNPVELRDVRLSLSAQVEIWGTLRYFDTGELAPGIPLVALTRETRFFGDVATVVDELGRFHFAGLAPVPHVITLADSFDRSEWTMRVYGPVRAKSGETVVDVDLFLERGASVGGVVYDAATGEPVAGVEVVAHAGPIFFTVVARATTDADGFYELRLPTGPSNVRTMTVPDGYAWSSRKKKLEIETWEERLENIDFELSPTESSKETEAAVTLVRGTVVLGDGTPVEGVLVSIRDVSEDRHVETVYTDASGEYGVRVAPGHLYALKAFGKKYSTTRSDEFEVFSPEFHDAGDRFFDGVAAFERTCRWANAVPVLILAHQAHASVVRSEMQKRELALAVGIDRYVPNTVYSNSNNATMIAYGTGRWPLVFLIGSDGIVRDVPSGLNRLDSLLEKHNR